MITTSPLIHRTGAATEVNVIIDVQRKSSNGGQHVKASSSVQNKLSSKKIQTCRYADTCVRFQSSLVSDVHVILIDFLCAENKTREGKNKSTRKHMQDMQTCDTEVI